MRIGYFLCSAWYRKNEQWLYFDWEIGSKVREFDSTYHNVLDNQQSQKKPNSLKWFVIRSSRVFWKFHNTYPQQFQFNFNNSMKKKRNKNDSILILVLVESAARKKKRNDCVMADILCIFVGFLSCYFCSFSSSSFSCLVWVFIIFSLFFMLFGIQVLIKLWWKTVLVPYE